MKEELTDNQKFILSHHYNAPFSVKQVKDRDYFELLDCRNDIWAKNNRKEDLEKLADLINKLAYTCCKIRLEDIEKINNCEPEKRITIIKRSSIKIKKQS